MTQMPRQAGSVAPKKILVVTSTYPRWHGDPEPGFVHKLCQHLADELEVHVLCPHSPGSKNIEIIDRIMIHRFRYAPKAMETLVSGGGIMANLKASRWKWLLVPFFLLSMTVAIIRLLGQIKPSLVHAHWIIPQGISLWLAGKFTKLPPVVLTSHGGDLFSLQGSMLRKIKSLAISAADHMTVVSSSMLDEAKRLGADSKNLSVAPMGVDFTKFRNPNNGSAPRVPGRILFVGRLVEKKGLTHLLAALPSVCKESPSAHVIIAGGGPELPRLQAQADKLGLREIVTFLGPVPHSDLPVLYSEATLFVAPFVRAQSGDIEGLGLVTLEAICCGCPPLVGEVPAVRDIFPAEHLEIFTIDPSDVEGFAQRITCLLRQQPDVTPLKNYVLSQFGWPVCAARYSEIYQRVQTMKS